MKNFTNLFKHKTNPLWIRLLIMAFMLLVGSSSVWAAISGGQVFYLSPGPWTADNAWFAMYLCNGSSTAQWVKLTKSGDYYTGTVPNGQSHKDVIFCRMNSSNTSKLDWTNVWNQTNDLTWSSGNCYTITGWGEGDGKWSTITVCEPATITWKTINTTMTKGSTQTISTTLTSGAGSVTYTSSNTDVVTVDGSILTAVGNGTATIAANHTNVTSGYCTAESITKSVTVSTVIPSGTKLWFDFSKATNWRNGHYLSIVGSSNTPYTANNSNTSGAGNYKPQSDATWVELTKECDGIYSYTTTSDISTGISLWSTNESSYGQVWQTDVILNIKASEFDPAKKCYTLGSTRTYHNDRQTYCFCGSWGSTIPHCCTDPTITLSNNEVTYNGSAQKPTFNGVIPTKVTYNDIELANGPTDADTYTVKVWADESGDFCEVVGVELTDKFVIKQKAPSDGDFTYTASKPYIGSPVSADVTWTQGTGTGTIITYYKVKGAADNTYTTTAPTNAGTYTVAVTTVAGGNYAAATDKIELDDFFEITKINQTTALTISNSSTSLCESSVTLTTSGGNGDGAVSFEIQDNTADATLDATTLTATKSGTVTVVAKKAGDTNYNETTSVSVTFTFTLLSAPTFSTDSKIACKNVAFDLNALFTRSDSGEGALEWYKEDDTKVQDPTNVSVSETTKYYAKLKDGSCYSEESSLVTAKINIPTISNIVITKESPTSISVTATITGEDLALGLVEYVFDERGMDWSFASSYRGAVVDNKFSCIINNLTEGRAYKIRVGANTGTCNTTYVYSDEYQITTDCATYPAPAITTSNIVCPNTNVTLSDYNNGVENVLWYSDAECNTRVNSTVKVAGETKYFARTQIGSCYSNVATLTLDVVKAPQVPTVTIVEGGVITCNETSIVQRGKIKITNYNANYDYIIGDNDNSPVNVAIENDEAYIYFDFGAAAFTLKAKEKTCGLFSEKSAPFEITESDNAPVITGNTSFQPNGSTTLTSDKGASTTWVALDGGDLKTKTGASVVFTAKDKGTYHVQATYNGCSTTYTIKVQDDLYVWVRRPIKKETAYDQFYHKNQNSKNAIGGDLFYKEFASLPGDYQQYNQGGKAADDTCTDKDGYTWYGFVVSKEAIENNYYFTVHAPNDGGEQGDAAKYNGFYTHTKVTRFDKDMTSDLYFVMDEVPSGSSEGWNINAPVVVRASGDAKFNANNFADFVPLYVKDANICGKEVVSFEWQKSDSENGTYNTYKSGKGINNIRTREAGWYRCVVTYGDGQGTATSNAIQVTTGATDVADYDSKYDVSDSNLPVIMVNTNGVGFPSDEKLSVYPSAKADDLKAKVSVDVIIKKGDEILYDKKARMNYRGSSSLNFKKKSYAFVSGQDSCVFDKSRHDYVKTKKAKMFEVLGKSGYSANDKDWVLYAATPDPSMMRNRLVFDLYQQMRNDWGVHTTYVELIVDGEYQGVYVFMDKITANEKRVNITNANGFIVKFDKTDCADRIGGYNDKVGDEKTFKTKRTGNKGIGTYDTTVDQLFEIEYPEKEDIEDEGGVWEEVYQPIIDRFEEFEEALSLGNYTRVRDIIDYDSWADWFVLTEFIKNQDGFRASCIFTFSGEQGDKIKATPLWDQELSMNNRARTSHGSSTSSGLLITTSSIYGDDFPAPFWFTGEKEPKNEINGGLLKDECFVSLVKEKWAQYSAAEGILSKDNIEPMIKAYAAELEEGAQTREETKWPYTGEVRGMTNNGKTVGYFGKNEGTAVNYEDSKADIISWAGTRVSPLTTEINKLEGEAIIFTLNPENPETTPWAPVLLTVNVPDDYKYNMDFTALPADAVIKEGNNNYSIKLPQPSDWVPGGDGGVKSATYVVKAKLEIGDETTVCGTTVKAEKQSTITLRETYEDCSED